MKKIYEKPEIVFENFSLSTNIAAGCEVINDLPSVNVCGYIGDFDDPVFTSTVTGCISKEVDSMNNTFCYHVPDGGPNLFNS